MTSEPTPSRDSSPDSASLPATTTTRGDNWRGNQPNQVAIGPNFTLQQQYDPIAEKMTEEHISAVIRNESDESRRAHVLAISRMAVVVLLVALALGFVLLFSWMFAATNQPLVEKVIVGIFGFIAGIGAGLVAPKAASSLGFRGSSE